MNQEVRKNKKFKRILFRIICLIAIVVLSILIYKFKNYKDNIDYQIKIREEHIDILNNDINIENQKTEELKDRKNTINSNNNIEKIARDEFGYIKQNEIILKPKE